MAAKIFQKIFWPFWQNPLILMTPPSEFLENIFCLLFEKSRIFSEINA